jgi:hypothetical protein
MIGLYLILLLGFAVSVVTCQYHYYKIKDPS